MSVATTRNAWKILAVTLLISALSNMDQSLFSYAVPGIMGDFKLDLSAVSLIISVSFGAAAVYTLLVGPITRALGPRLVLALSLAGSALFVGLQALATTAVGFAAARALGFALSASVPSVTSAYLAAATPTRWRAIGLAVLQCGYPLGWYISSLVAGHYVTSSGWRSSFMIAFAVIPLAVLLYALLPRDSESGATAAAAAPTGEEKQSMLAALFSAAHRRPAVAFGLGFFLYGGAVGGISWYLPTFFQQSRGYDAATATQVVGISYAVGMVGYIASALVSEYWLSRRTTAITWLWLGGIGLLATIWLPRTPMQDMVVFGITTVFFNGSSSILFTALLESFPLYLRTTAAAVSGSTCLCVGFIVYPIVTAAAQLQVGWLWAFTIVIVPSVLAAGALILNLQRAERLRPIEQTA